MHSVYCADVAACGLSEAIQSLPPELREMIQKEYIAILKLPFCEFKQQIVQMVICFEYADSCFFEGCCFSCFEREENIHKASLSRPMELIEASPEHNNF